MAVSKHYLETLKQKIFASFENVPYPKGRIAPHECDECNDVCKTFKNKDWKTISPEILEENYGIIPLFSPEAFQYFLPAYLSYSLESFYEESDTVCEFTIYAIAPTNNDVKERMEYWRDKFANFTSEQMNCIYDFLDIARIDENFKVSTKEISVGRQNLREFIDPNFIK